MAEPADPDTGVITKSKTEHKLARPRLYRVLVHNDDYTTREFVVEALVSVFHHSEPEATRIMLLVHQNGLGVAGVFTHEVAETKVATVHHLARRYDFPLRLTLEPEE